MAQGTLKKNEIGRFEFDGRELSSGDMVELRLQTEWIRGRIEYDHDFKGYYFISARGTFIPPIGCDAREIES